MGKYRLFNYAGLPGGIQKVKELMSSLAITLSWKHRLLPIFTGIDGALNCFFKKLKQNFPLHYFLGDNQNAIEIQIWCALIALLLLSHIHFQNKSKMAFSNMVAILRMHLPSYISIKNLLALHNKKRLRYKKAQLQQDLFTNF